MSNLETAKSAEQLAFDLAKALQFTLPDLRAFRRGILPVASCQILLKTALQPIFKSVVISVGSSIALAYLTGSSQHSSLTQKYVDLFSHILNFQEFAQTQGWFIALICVVGGLASVGSSVYLLTRIKINLLADIVAKQVSSFDGRVTDREQETPGATKRDALPDYYFETKMCSFLVNRRAFLAIDSGGLYRVYYLPRSQTLVAIEPALLAREADERERKLKETSAVPSTI